MTGILGSDRLSALLRLALERSRADQTEARISVSRWALTRFANSSIHQSLESDYALIRVRAVFGKKVASATTTRLDEDSVAALVDSVVDLARHTDENPDFVSLPQPQPAPEAASRFCSSTAECSAGRRAGVVSAIVAQSDRIKGSAAGSVFTRAYEHAVMNSLGVDSYYSGTAADALTVVTGPSGGFGYAEQRSADFDEIDGSAMGAEAARLASDSRNPADLEPGEYECILSPVAAGTLIRYLVWAGFGGLAYQENRSFLCGRLGQRILHESVGIVDDALDPSGFVNLYDAEGIPRRRVCLVRNGVAEELMHDSYSAYKAGVQSNGYALGADDECSGSALNLMVAPGGASIGDMIASTRRGVLVTRFHYVNYAHRMTATVTGMTRDGTFLIEDGRIAHPVKNIRFTQSILDALSRVEMVGRERQLVADACVPAIKVSAFRFTSATEF